MRNFQFCYLCVALSILCVLLVSCKDDEVPYPAGERLVNYEITLIRLDINAPSPSSLPKDCIVYRDYAENDVDMDNYIIPTFYYEGNNYPTRGLSVSDIRILNIDNSPVKALLSGEFFIERYPEAVLWANSKSEMDKYIGFCVSSITLK